ncbi:hypothetical protein P8631_03330 [Guyparkeria sp. 1SP6A2]|nr:hypothetical protein [Guyparkeria sp. 1SP6A2]
MASVIHLPEANDLPGRPLLLEGVATERALMLDGPGRDAARQKRILDDVWAVVAFWKGG